jgi:signal transduction histidine kinase
MEADLNEQEELMIAQSRHAAMGEMISMIAHQWRQPISVISMDANNILVDVELDNINYNSLKNDATDIITQTQHLSKTIDDFRNFFKPNKLKDSVVVSDVFLETMRVIDKSLENNNIEVQNVFETDTAIEIFSRELLQVFLNILKNAKEALVENRKSERKITNRVYETEESIIVEICNNGGKIKEEIISRIFDPYFSTKSEKNGTGLGLYMSKTIVEKHLKGRLWVENRGVDEVCFMIKLSKKEQQHG